jgi:hypothetical protein
VVKIRTFDALVGRKLRLESGAGSHRFVLESLLSNVAVLSPVDRTAAAFGRSVERGTPLRVVASVDGGMLSADTEVERWSERNKALHVYRPRSMEFSQRRRTVRLPVRLGLELSVVRDGVVCCVGGVTEDLAIGGFAAVLDGRVEVGESVVALLRLPNGSVATVAQVTAVDAIRVGLTHVRFDVISPDDYRVLVSALQIVEDGLEKQGVRV